MRIVTKVELTQEELDAIKILSDLDCRCIKHCEDECPLKLSRGIDCIKFLAQSTFEKVTRVKE